MRFKLLGNSGLRVSEICLGTMTFGEEWGWGADKKTSKAIFDHYANLGGNFIDTANRYTEGTSERFVGEFVKSDRDHFVVATKYTLFDKPNDLNYAGNHRKNMMRSVEASLSRLRTDFIDLLWVHMWDGTTPIDEIMKGMEDLVRQGKVNYIGISDTPAWIVSRANTIAEFRGWAKFVALQVEYSLLQRTPERDLLPMANSLGLALTPWAPLGGGALTGKYLKGESAGRVKEESTRRSERSNRIAQVVVDIAEELGVSPAQLATRWTMQQSHTSIPIVGARKLDQVVDSMKAAEVSIPEEAMTRLNDASAIELGFPHDFLKQDGVKHVSFGGDRDKLDF
ncbi:MAG: aldo/keto reductase [Bacteroidota bacterium]